MILNIKKKKGEIEPPKDKDVVVKLKPVFGMKPRVYLRVAYSLILIFILYLLLIFPGTYKRGSRYVVKSQPSGAAVFVDEKYRGSTPCKFFIPEGEHILRIEKAFFEGYSEDISTGNRVFFSLFYPKTVKIKKDLSIEDKNVSKYCNMVLAEFNDFCIADKEYVKRKSAYYMPPSISSFVEEMSGFFDDNTILELIKDARYSVNNSIQADDVVLAYKIFADKKLKNSEAALEVIKLDKSSASLNFFNCLDRDLKKSIKSEPFIKELKKEFSTKRDLNFYPNATGKVKSFAGIRFIEIEAGSANFYNSNSMTSTEINFDSFFIADRETTVAQFNRFLVANPKFKAGNKELLEKSGFVDQYYMEDYNFSKSNYPATSISWKVAKEFCNWLQKDYVGSDYKVRLPHYYELVAISSNVDTATCSFSEKNLKPVNYRSGSCGVYDLLGNVWELTDDSFYSKNFVTDDELLNLPTEFKCVFGGCYKNSFLKIDFYSCGAYSVKWASPFGGFRVVLEKI